MQQAQQADFKPFEAPDWRIAFVVAQFNRHITEQMKQAALQRAAEYKLADPVNIFEVAGAIEIPLVSAQLAKTRRYQAILAIGCVIKGETPHFDYVCKFVTEGILRAQLDHDQPIGFGVLTCNDESQALSRVQLAADHLDAVLQQAKLLQDLSQN